MSRGDLHVRFESKKIDFHSEKTQDVKLTVDSVPDIMVMVPPEELNIIVEAQGIRIEVDDSPSDIELTLKKLPDVIVLPAGGLKGPPGPKGEQGPEGRVGLTGPPGADSTVPGPPGPQGVEGPIGPEGVPGTTGQQGPPGPQGATGAQGLTGPTGPTGSPGADSTVPGPQGPQGVKGDTGDQGPAGIQGPQGVEGPQGDMGPMGTVYDSDQIGTVKAWSGKVIPTNWMLADGRTVNRIDYPQLADEYGIPVEQATFQIPNCVDRFLYGATTTAEIGLTGGEAAHVLSVGEMPTHSHTVNSHSHGGVTGGGTTGTVSSDHTHAVGMDGGNSVHSHPGAAGASFAMSFIQDAASGTARKSVMGIAGTTGDSGSHTHNAWTGGISANHTHSVPSLSISAEAPGTNSQGSGTAHNNMPPWVKVGWIVKVTGAQIDGAGALKGETGAQGPQGVPGPQGIQGPQGPAGTQGEDGVLEVYEQPAQPTSTEVGALWIDTDDIPAVWTSLIPTVAALPSNPTDGQEVYLYVGGQDIFWHLRYRASIGFWDFLGGPPMFVQSTAQANVVSSTPTGVAPSMTLPLIGFFDFHFGARLYHQNGAGVNVAMYLYLGGVQQFPNIDHFQGSVGSQITLFASNDNQRLRKEVIAANTLVEVKMAVPSGTGSSDNRFIEATPVKVKAA